MTFLSSNLMLVTALSISLFEAMRSSRWSLISGSKDLGISYTNPACLLGLVSGDVNSLGGQLVGWLASAPACACDSGCSTSLIEGWCCTVLIWNVAVSGSFSLMPPSLMIEFSVMTSLRGREWCGGSCRLGAGFLGQGDGVESLFCLNLAQWTGSLVLICFGRFRCVYVSMMPMRVQQHCWCVWYEGWASFE